MTGPAEASSARLPIVDGDSAPYWAAAAEGRLTAQCCGACGRFVFHPRSLCPYCHRSDLTWRDLSGSGTVYSYTITRRAPSPEFAALVPYVVALVDLDEDLRLMTHVVGPDALRVRCGDRVRVRFESVAPDRALPVFELVTDD